jgi:hypothetical protein
MRRGGEKMRKIVIMGTVVALILAVFAPAALARTFTCTDLPCFGTDRRDTIDERPAFGTPDEIYGLSNADYIDASRSGGDEDTVYGNRGNDTIDTDDGDSLDEVIGGAGTDTCYVDSGDVVRSCEVVYVNGVLQP